MIHDELGPYSYLSLIVLYTDDIVPFFVFFYRLTDYILSMIADKPNKIISRNKDILGGTPVFHGTRVPIKTLWDYLKAGDSLEDFLEDFPSVKRKQAVALIERAQNRLTKIS